MKEVSAKRAKVLFLIIFLFASLSNWVVTPIFEIYDEGAHVGYVYYLRTHHRLPVYKRSIPWEKQPFGQEAAQPPLYYLFEAVLSSPFSMEDFTKVWKINPHAKIGVPKATDNHNYFLHDPYYERFPWKGTGLAVRAMRLLSIAMALWTLLLVYELAWALSNGNAILSLVSMAVVAFNPAFVHIAAGVNNDWFVIPIATLVVLRVVNRVKSNKTPTLASTLWLGFLIGLAVLSKITGILLLPLVGLMLLWEWRGEKINAKGLFTHLIVLIGVVLLMTTWWLYRNYSLYRDPLATVVHVWRWGSPRHHRGLKEVLLHETQGIWIFFWGVFGLGTMILPDIALNWIDAVMFLSVTGMCFEYKNIFTKERNSIAAWALVVLWGVFVLAGLLRWTLIVLASQGRLLYPAIGSFAVVVGAGVQGWSRIIPEKALSIGVSIAFGGIAAISILTPWFIIKPAFALPQHGQQISETPKLTPARVSFGNNILVLGYEAHVCDSATSKGETLIVRNGDAICVTLLLRAESKMKKNYSMSIQVVPPSVPPLAAQLDTYPGGGNMPTTFWRKGEEVLDKYKLTVNYNAPHPVKSRLQVVFYDFSTRKRLIAINLASGNRLWDDALVLKDVLINPPVNR